MIDLHTHTTASDGRCSPAELVSIAAVRGVTILSVTDHDTVAGSEAAAAACDALKVTFVPGIEITAMRDGIDVHVLGYFIDTNSRRLHAFLAEQRARRLTRVRAMIERLAALGMPLHADAILKPGIDDPARTVGRPAIARALIAAGYVADTNEAFERWLSHGRPAYVPREAATPEDVFARIHDAGGLASLAHPGLLRHDDWIPGFAAAGLDALEVYHTDHDESVTARYFDLARRHGLAISGGSDYHADEVHGGRGPGSVTLPRQHYDELLHRKARKDRNT